MDDTEFERLSKEFRSLKERLLYAAYKPTDPLRNRKWLTASHIPQGQLYMIMMLPTIFKCIGKCHGDLKIADIGCGMGAGTQLLASLTQSRFFGERQIRVSGFDPMSIDNVNVYERYNRAFNENVDFEARALDHLPDEKAFDITICSNVFEHFEDPFPAINKMKRITKKFAIIMVPYYEPLGVEPDHKTCFTDPVINSLSPSEVQTFTHVGTQQGDQVCFVLDCREMSQAQRLKDKLREGVRDMVDANMRTRLTKHALGRAIMAITRRARLAKIIRSLVH